MAKRKSTKTPPQYSALEYRFDFQNLDARHYKLINGHLDKMPDELIIEKIRNAATVEAAMYARSTQANGKHILKTGIRPLNSHIAVGDQFEIVKGSKVNHLLIFVFSSDKQILTVYTS